MLEWGGGVMAYTTAEQHHNQGEVEILKYSRDRLRCLLGVGYGANTFPFMRWVLVSRIKVEIYHVNRANLILSCNS